MFNLNIDYSKRIWGLDLVRSIAILLVVVYHMRWMTVTWPSILKKIFSGSGILGVEIFFVLSGYLIGGILYTLEKENSGWYSVFEFWKRRWIRTLPLYYIVLTATFLVFYGLGFVHFEYGLFNYYFFIQNLYTNKLFFFTVSWSLSIEEWTYLISPIVLIVISIKSQYSFIIKTMCMMAIYIVYRNLYLFTHLGYNIDWNSDIRQIVIYRLDAILFGFIAVFMMKKYKDMVVKLRYAFFVFGIFILVIASLFYNHNIATSSILKVNIVSANILSIMSMGIMLIMPAIIFIKRIALVGNIVSFISIISYSVYLLHDDLIIILLKHFAGGIIAHSVILSMAIYAITILVIFVASFFSYKYIEYPILQLRDKK